MARKIKEKHKALLRHEFGTVMRGTTIVGIPRISKVFAVGDMSSAFLINNGYEPPLVIYDGKVERAPASENVTRSIENYAARQVEVENPAGCITDALYEEIRKALESGEKVKIKVNGEEDMAALAVGMLAPEGTFLLYGLRAQGMDLVPIDRFTKLTLKKIYNLMEEFK